MRPVPESRGVHKIGRRAEEAAYRYLASQGLTLLERNFRHRRGEIDLIMREKTCIVFVEVRYRSSPRYGSALESVDRRKQEKLVMTAQHYLQTHARAAQQTARFDVISIEPGAQDPSITWIKDAFRA
jgi:putative endonuclease